MPDMLKLAVLGVAAALCAVVVRKSTAELGLVLALAAVAMYLLVLRAEKFLNQLWGVHA